MVGQVFRFPGRGGQLGAVGHQGPITLSRPMQSGSRLDARKVDSQQSVSDTTVTGNLAADLYDAFYNIDLQNRVDQAHRAAHWMRTQLRVPIGISRWATQSEYLTWKTQADARVARLESLQREMAQAENERDRCRREIENLKLTYTARLQGLENEIAPGVISFSRTSQAPTASIADCRKKRNAFVKDENDPVQSAALVDCSMAAFCNPTHRADMDCPMPWDQRSSPPSSDCLAKLLAIAEACCPSRTLEEVRNWLRMATAIKIPPPTRAAQPRIG